MALSFQTPTAAADWGDGVGVTAGGSATAGGCATATGEGAEFESAPQLVSIIDKTPQASAECTRDSLPEKLPDPVFMSRPQISRFAACLRRNDAEPVDDGAARLTSTYAVAGRQNRVKSPSKSDMMGLIGFGPTQEARKLIACAFATGKFVTASSIAKKRAIRWTWTSKFCAR